jgi:hypothetical protein
VKVIVWHWIFFLELLPTAHTPLTAVCHCQFRPCFPSCLRSPLSVRKGCGFINANSSRTAIMSCVAAVSSRSSMRRSCSPATSHLTEHIHGGLGVLLLPEAQMPTPVSRARCSSEVVAGTQGGGGLGANGVLSVGSLARFLPRSAVAAKRRETTGAIGSAITAHSAALAVSFCGGPFGHLSTSTSFFRCPAKPATSCRCPRLPAWRQRQRLAAASPYPAATRPKRAGWRTIGLWRPHAGQRRGRHQFE